MSEWDSEESRHSSAPLRAFAVLLGRVSLGYQPPLDDADDFERQRRRNTRDVDWSAPIPDNDLLWQFTVAIWDAGLRVESADIAAMGATPIGTFTLPTSEQVWIVRHLIPFHDELKQRAHAELEGALNRLPIDRNEPAVYRAHLVGHDDSGLRWVFQLSVTAGPIPEELEIL